MKIKPFEADRFLTSIPATIRAILIYGPDNGAVRLSTQKAIQGLRQTDSAGDPLDSFNLRALSAKQCADEPALLTQEAGNLSLGGGRVVVRVREAADICTKSLEIFLARPDAAGIVVLDSGNLTPRSTLRKLVEKDDACAAVARYADDPKQVVALVQQRLRATGSTIEREGLIAFTARLGDDRAITENEIEKLLLYMGEDKKITLKDVLAATGDRAALGLDELADCVGLGETKKALRHFDRLIATGQNHVLIINALARHFQKLRLVLSGAGNPSQNILRLAPPLHFTRKDRFLRQCSIWDLTTTRRALEILWRTNLALRRSAPPSLCGQTLLSLAQRANKRAGR